MLKQKRNAKPIRWGLKKIGWGLINITVPRHTPRSWIEANFQKRDCIKYIPDPKDEEKCCCGQSRVHHPTLGIEIGSPDAWTPYRHTRQHPTDAYGTIEFQGGAHPTKAQYVRLSYDTRPELIVQLFTREWNLELPKLLITVQGGKANFELQPKLKKEIRKGLLKAAKTTGAWVFTGGTNTGVTKQVGDALLLEGQQRTGRVASIGIAPWGIVERNYELVGHNRDVPCHSISSPRSKLAVLNNRHAYFLLVDNGSQGKYGAEIILRRKLEKYISNLKLHPFTHSSTPVVCLVIEGGMNTIRAVLEYVTDTPPVPVVVCDGSGRAADLIAFVHKYAAKSDDQSVLENAKDLLIGMIQKTFEVGTKQAEQLYDELIECTKNRNLITVFRIQDRMDGGEAQELDQTILTALFKSQHLSPPEQLSLALTWNRSDIARSEIFVYGQEWPMGSLDEAMMQALEHDRIDFVKLLLENGVSMKKFLTIPRLEELYNTKHGPANTLGYILRDVRPHIPKGYVYTLHDIGLVINKLMGGAYRSYYTRRKFRPIYAKVMNSYVNNHRKPSTFTRNPAANSMSLVTGLLPVTSEMALFEFPFNELLIWAVLTKRQQMAELMWTHGEEALAKSLVSCKLYKAMAHEAAEDDLDTEIYEELKTYAKEFENRGLKLLDFCYRQDQEKAQRLLTCELNSWSSQSCLSLAVSANHRALLAHPCSQVILADLWMGALRTRKNTNFKVILGLLCPFFIRTLDFKSKEELQQMPQTEAEHLENQSLDYDENEKPQSDAENSAKPRRSSVSLKFKMGNQSASQALLSDPYLLRETKVQENGKLRRTSSSLGFTKNASKVSLTESELGPNRDFMQLSYDYEYVKQHRPLKLKKKIYEFYTAPITKFWADSLAYVFFLVMFTYTVLVKMHKTPNWQEVYSIAYITALGCEKIREIISSEPVAITHKFSVWAWNMWNPCDAAAIILFMVGLVLRFHDNSMDVGRVIYCIDSIYWYLRILNILGVNKYLGPLVTMMGKMVKNMIYFVVLLLVVLMSFGVSRQSILFPSEEASWRLIRDVYFQPYFMLYGEVFADDIDPPCGEEGQPECVTGHWLTPITMSMYLLIANILLINLLIAVFNNIFIEVNAVSHQVWMFQRFTVVMEYQLKPVLPPPFISICHIYSVLKYFVRKAKGLQGPRDNGLKLFLEKDDMERLYDFEEECMEGYFREQEVLLHQSTEECIKTTTERVENMAQKIEDINTKENVQSATVQSMDHRLRKMEESAEQILAHLAVIHRFMSTHTSLASDHLPGSLGNVSQLRQRSNSENEPFAAGLGLALAGGPLPSRRKYNRSYTEGQPDVNPFEDFGAFIRSAAVPEESESAVRSKEALNIPTPPPVQQPPLQQHNVPSVKVSSQSIDSEVFEREHGNAAQQGRQTRQESTESRETGLEGSDDQTLIGEAETPEDTPDEGFLLDVMPGARRLRRRTSSMCRRNSESCNYDVHRSQTSLHKSTSRRQLSAPSEPDSLDLPPAKHCQQKSARNMLLQFHAEYTSITDELESVCHMMVSPTSTTSVDKPPNELKNHEFAAMMETQHLKECEDNDYEIMKRLLVARQSLEVADGMGDNGGPSNSRKTLKRDTAFEVPGTPSKSGGGMGMGGIVGVTEESEGRHFNRNASADRAYQVSSSLLNPQSQDHRRLRKSMDSLAKNSSTDTEYSLHPYRVIKQSSNETNTSLTGSSFNVENSSSLEAPGDSSLNQTVIENVPVQEIQRSASVGAAARQPLKLGAAFLRKQFSTEKSVRIDPESSMPFLSNKGTGAQFPVPGGGAQSPIAEDVGLEYQSEAVGSGVALKATAAAKKQMPVGMGSSSSEDSRPILEKRVAIPVINTEVIQEEIAKLSSTIKSTSGSEEDPSAGKGEEDEEESKKNSSKGKFNETMC